MITESVKVSPPVSATALTLAGVSLQDWVCVATIAYTLLLIYFRLRKEWKTWKAKKVVDDDDA